MSNNKGIRKLSYRHLLFFIIKRLSLELRKPEESKIGKRHSFKVSDDAPNVLITYISEVYDKHNDRSWMNGHANRWQAVEITKLFLGKGYNVDIIDHRDTDFKPEKEYEVLFGHEPLYWDLVRNYQFKRKIYYATTLTWIHRNQAIKARTHELFSRRNIKLNYPPLDPEHYSWDYSDAVFYFGNDFYLETIKKLIKPRPQFFKIQNGIPGIKAAENKDFNITKKNFLYIGSWGPVFRGLDRLIEIFSNHPEFNLFICTDILYNTVFFWKFRKELFGRKNIFTLGFVDTNSEYFNDVVGNCCWQIYPSGSEASASSVVLGLRKGLIPIISKECTVDTGGMGYILPDNSIDTIEEYVIKATGLSPKECERLSGSIIKYSEKEYSGDAFRYSFKEALDKVLD